MEPLFLRLDEILAIHQDQIARYHGDPGIRDMTLLKSAIAQPCATYDGQFLHSSYEEMAAAYLYHLVNNHACIDGNKRLGAVSSVVFLLMNGYTFDAPQHDFTELVMSVAQGQTSKSEVLRFFQSWAKKI